MAWVEDASQVASREDAALVAALRSGDETAFERLVGDYGPAMLRVARLFVPTRSIAEEVVQDAWVGVLRGLDRFEGRSSLRTWIFRILTNTAKSRGVRERRSTPFSALGGEAAGDEPAVEPDRFLPRDDPQWPGGWTTFPRPWDTLPEGRLIAAETRRVIRDAIDALPPGQKAVISLRDVEGWSAEEVCNALDLSETNQRVLLHRARSRVRGALEQYLDQEET